MCIRDSDTPVIVDPNDPNNPNPTIPAQTGDDSVALTDLDVSPFFDDVDGETLSFTSPDIPSWMSINPATGVITGTPPADASQGGPNGDGIYVITIVATDPDGQQVTTQVTYTISNPIPVVDIPIGPRTAVDGETLSIPTAISDPDGDVLTYTVTGLPAGLSIDPATGEIAGTIDNSASQVNDGLYIIAVTADDGQGGVITDTFELTVINPGPIAVDDALTASEDDVLISGNVFNDNGAGLDTDPDGDAFSVVAIDGAVTNIGQAVAGSNGGLFTINPDGTYNFEPNGEFEGLDEGETATTTVTYTISDGEGGFDTATVTVTIIGQNDAPIIVNPEDPNDENPSIPDQLGNDSEVLPPLNLADYFTDPDGERTFFDIEGEPSWLTVNAFTGVVTATAPPADASQGGPNGDGVYSITVVASDADGVETRVIVNYIILSLIHI